MTKKSNPLQTGKFYKIKKPIRNFLCALCSAPRSMRYSKHLGVMHYLQILVISTALIWFSFDLFREKSFFIPIFVWMCFEIINKMLYRKDIACPYCGFDATWYRRDVKLARSKVNSFWEQNYPELVKKKEDEVTTQNNSSESENLNAAESQNPIN